MPKGPIKGDLAIRPIYHQLQGRIEAHILRFWSRLGGMTLSRRLRDLAPGLTARSVLEKFAAVSRRGGTRCASAHQ